MTATLLDVAAKKKQAEQSAEQQAATELARPVLLATSRRLLAVNTEACRMRIHWERCS